MRRYRKREMRHLRIIYFSICLGAAPEENFHTMFGLKTRCTPHSHFPHNIISCYPLSSNNNPTIITSIYTTKTSGILASGSRRQYHYYQHQHHPWQNPMKRNYRRNRSGNAAFFTSSLSLRRGILKSHDDRTGIFKVKYHDYSTMGSNAGGAPYSNNNNHLNHRHQQHQQHQSHQSQQFSPNQIPSYQQQQYQQQPPQIITDPKTGAPQIIIHTNVIPYTPQGDAAAAGIPPQNAPYFQGSHPSQNDAYSANAYGQQDREREYRSGTSAAGLDWATLIWRMLLCSSMVYSLMKFTFTSETEETFSHFCRQQFPRLIRILRKLHELDQKYVIPVLNDDTLSLQDKLSKLEQAPLEERASLMKQFVEIWMDPAWLKVIHSVRTFENVFLSFESTPWPLFFKSLLPIPEESAAEYGSKKQSYPLTRKEVISVSLNIMATNRELVSLYNEQQPHANSTLETATELFTSVFGSESTESFAEGADRLLSQIPSSFSSPLNSSLISSVASFDKVCFQLFAASVLLHDDLAFHALSQHTVLHDLCHFREMYPNDFVMVDKTIYNLLCNRKCHYYVQKEDFLGMISHFKSMDIHRDQFGALNQHLFASVVDALYLVSHKQTSPPPSLFTNLKNEITNFLSSKKHAEERIISQAYEMKESFHIHDPPAGDCAHLFSLHPDLFDILQKTLKNNANRWQYTVMTNMAKNQEYLHKLLVKTIWTRAWEPWSDITESMFVGFTALALMFIARNTRRLVSRSRKLPELTHGFLPAFVLYSSTAFLDRHADRFPAGGLCTSLDWYLAVKLWIWMFSSFYIGPALLLPLILFFIYNKGGLFISISTEVEEED